MSNSVPGPWLYPRWIAHRGAGKLAPENTLAAFKTGASFGYNMFECDVKSSADDMPFLLHDDTLERTTNGSGVGSDHTLQALQLLDAGSWHSAAFAGTRIPSLDEVAQYCIANGFDLNIEIKPTTGSDEKTGEAVARHAARLWQHAARKPLLSSFKPDALQAALNTAPDLPRALLLHDLWTGWLETALMLGCSAVICNYRLWDTSSVTQAKSAGFKLMAYTVNDQVLANRLLAMGIDGIITDAVNTLKPNA